MAQWICERCGIEFERGKCGSRRIRFCSQPCYHKWAKENRAYSGYGKGHEPWNKGLNGIHLSPLTEFKAGQASGYAAIVKSPLGTIRIRQVADDTERAWVKTGEPHEWEPRAHVEWRKHHGEIPSGFIIHHKDRNTLNDEIDNLELLTRAEHLAEHRAEYLLVKLENRRTRSSTETMTPEVICA